jgi:negative regulator of flagellin synthesis FlgM
MRRIGDPSERGDGMKITGSGNSIHLDAYLKSAQTGKRADTQATARTGGDAQDKVAISERAMEVRRAREALEALPEVRQEKVDALRRQIDQGTYTVKGDKIALNMITESLVNALA